MGNIVKLRVGLGLAVEQLGTHLILLFMHRVTLMGCFELVEDFCNNSILFMTWFKLIVRTYYVYPIPMHTTPCTPHIIQHHIIQHLPVVL